MMRPVIVMAGTPVDTQMGMDCLAAQGVEGVFCSISKDPVEQTAFQISSEREKAAVVTALFREAQAAHGCEQAFIYCNSLSGSVNFDAIARETGVAVVTPLDVYRAWRRSTAPLRSLPPTRRAPPVSSGRCCCPTRI